MESAPAPFECARCGYTTLKRDLLTKHLKRKVPCTPKDADSQQVTMGDLLVQFRTRAPRCHRDADTNMYSCSWCHKLFKSRNGKCKHMKHCTAKLIAEEKESSIIEIKGQLQEQRLQYAELKQMYERLEQEMLKRNVTQIHVGDCTQNNNLILNIRPFGQENLDYLLTGDDPALKGILEDRGTFFQNLVKAIHFNEEHPENMNVYVSNLRGKHALVYDGLQFSVKLKDETMNKLVVDKQTLLENTYSGIGLDPATLSYIEGKIHRLKEDKEVKEQLKSKLELMCYNERTKIQHRAIEPVGSVYGGSMMPAREVVLHDY